jgi:hypothetical protein
MTEELEILKLVTGRLEVNNIPYMVSGSVAMNFYGQPRMTRDIDIVVELSSPIIVQNFSQMFADIFYVDNEMIESAIKTKGMFNIIHNERFVKVDFIVKKNLPYRNTEFERKRKIAVEDFSIYTVSPEDLILSKLYWAKETESEMQVRDVVNIIKSLPSLDRNYLFSWAKQLGIVESLQTIMNK